MNSAIATKTSILVSVNNIISYKLYSLISLPFNQNIKEDAHYYQMFLNENVVGAILPFELFILATTLTPTDNKNKISIKQFARNIEQRHVTKLSGS